ncbi:GPI transamidase component PIG-S isoform X2 [Rhopalosiphum maidis]|nr:GPI transamidase component PIG-S isoform X2 [Rhopalosiphum maidis]XP_026807180.1 GPI transamidase component PIG-S isoform X2 [Rhopalosiphum maidis]XP_026807181.1 GPI transamidase component PIG-S isoform X2 [Rhopalosiphum maidis]
MDTLADDKQSTDKVETLKNDVSNDEIWEIIDKEDDEDLRNLSAAVYAFILLVIGIPLWWRMTEVQRHSLPYAQILQLGTMDVVISTDIFIYTKNPYVTKDIIKKINTRFNSTMFSINAQPSTLVNSDQTLNELEMGITPLGSLQLIETNSVDDIIVGIGRNIYFPPNTDITLLMDSLIRLLQTDALSDSMISMLNPGNHSDDQQIVTERQRRVRPSSDYNVLLTVVNPEPDKLHVAWKPEIPLKRYLHPLLDQLKLISNFSVQSQWLYLIDLVQKPPKLNTTFVLDKNHAQYIITPLEKKLGSGVSRNPCIHFVVYITPCSYIPLYFHEDNQLTTAMMSARWGGVQFLNADQISCNESVSFIPDDLSIMTPIITQFHSLIGVPNMSNYMSLMPLKSSTLRKWQLDSMYRLKIIEQYTNTRITLTSLSRLLGEISNIVIIEEVGKAVTESVEAATKVLHCLRRGQLEEALEYSKIAFETSEFAFTHPSLLALLYFPDDQKYAVYIPLFLPVMIPVLMSLKGVKSWIQLKYNI